jgi:hypothetical protein
MQEKPDAKTKLVQGRYRTLLVLWVAILWTIVILVAVPVMIKRPPQPDANQRLFWIFLGLSLAAVAASFLMKGILLARAERAQNLTLTAQAYILAFALCESSCIFGLMAYFTGVSRYYYLLFIPGNVCMLFHMPRRERLLAASYKAEG